ncbi:MAG: cache domain-containing protein, partial [Betaproteobacteria bacterium]
MAATSLPAALPPASPAPRDMHRGRLFRKYLLLILSLVTIALLASGAISVYFSYQENKSALASLQHEKAIAAASRIEQYIRQIEQQLAYAALPQLDASDVESRRIEFLKLLRQAPEVTDIAQLDAAGREQIAVSRLGMDNVGSGKDRSQEPAFANARRGRPWFGPVYFRKETEPYMTIAIRSGGDKGPVTVADVNLKFIWDVISRIKIGDKGKAYVVDGNGFLIADPDIGLVLRKTNLSGLAHVKAAITSREPDDLAMLSTDAAGTSVLTSVAPIETLNWKVFVEQPVAEVYAKLNASIVRTGLLLLAGLVISALGALALARGMVRPIRTLDEGARRIGTGNLDQQIEVKTGDELEGLADQFNRMTAQLRESYAGLERKVDERTRELTSSLEQQTAISEILRVISSSPTDVKPVLDAVAERAAHLCEAPSARVLLVDGDTLRAVADYSVEGEKLPPPPGPLPLRRSLITGRAMLDRQTIHHADVLPLLDTEYPDSRESILALGARAMLAVPLMREGGAYGAIFLFRREPVLFLPDQVALVQTFARQAAIAIDNVRLFNETREALEQQTATAEILRVISGSITDTQPVFDAIVRSCQRLFGGRAVSLVLPRETMLESVAFASDGRDGGDGGFLTPWPLDRGSGAGACILESRVIAVADTVEGAKRFPRMQHLALALGYRSALFVP